MKINTEMILALEPCEDLKENYLKFYKDFEGSLEEFLKLEEISFYDKVSVAVRLVDKNTRIKFAMKCAEYVLPIFEKVFKDDKRIRNCIEFLNSIDDFENLNDDQLELLRFHNVAASSAANVAESSAFSSYDNYDDYVAASFVAKSVYYVARDVAIAADYACDAMSRSNYNTLKNHSTILKFLLDSINEKKEINNELYKL